MTEAERRIILCPIVKIECGVLDLLKKDLEKTFDRPTAKHSAIRMPAGVLDRSRKQYLATPILTKLHRLIPSDSQDRVLGVADVDLYAKGLVFIFGQAELGGTCAVISLTRLRQTFYSLPVNKPLFLRRAKKEAVHELGHVFGLPHCPDPECVMHFSNSLMDTDKKRAAFCARCRMTLDVGLE
jgi:archaemetzincin